MAEAPGKPVNLGGVAEGLPQYRPVPGYFGGGGGEKKTSLSFDEMVKNIPTDVGGAPAIPASSIYVGDRYASSFPFRNTEEMYAQQQGAFEKWRNGIIKMAGTASTSFLSGTVGTVVGATNYMFSGFKTSAFYDNPVNRFADEVNKKMEDYVPNYYTQAEKDANWFSGENLLTANFWSDKVFKNLGYSIGALAGGVGWAALFKSIGLTNKLVRAGRGLEAVTAVDEAIATAPAAGRFGAISNALNSVSNKFIKPAAGAFVPGEQGLISFMGSLGESSIEALGGMNEYRDRLINAYVEENGVRPTGADLADINSRAEDVGNFIWGMNTILLTATNRIQLPKILNSSKTAERRMMNDVVKTKLDDAATIAQKVEGKFEPELYKGKLLSAIPIPYEKIAGRPGKFFGKYIARPIGLLFSPAEAFEEGAQFAIQTGVDNYFNRAYENKEETSGFWSTFGDVFKNVLSEGVNKTLSSKEGMESILIGGVAGGLQTSFSPFGTSDVRERGLFGEGGIRAKNTALAIQELNNSKKLNQVLKDAVKYVNIGINSQKLRREAISENDTLSEKDYEKDFALSYIMPRVKYGKVDSIKEELKLYKEAASTEEGFNQLRDVEGVVLPGETVQKFIQRLDYIQKSAEDVSKMYEMMDDKYSAIVDEDGKRLFDDGVIDKMVYASAKIVDYDERLAGLKTKLFTQGVDTNNFEQTLIQTEEWKKGDIKGALTNPEVEKALKDVGAFIDGQEIDEKKKDMRTDFSDFAEMMLRRKTFIQEYNDIIKSPEKYKEVTAPEYKSSDEKQKEGEKKNVVRLKTQKGEMDFNIGEEYFLSRKVEESEEGFPIFKYPKFTILEELPDGKLRTRDANGKIVDVSKSAFAKYKFGKLSDALASKKGKFFLDAIGKVVEMKRKGGKKIEGWLEWSDKPGTLIFSYYDYKNKLSSFEVKGEQFKPKPGFKEGLFSIKGALTPKEKQSFDEFVDSKEGEGVVVDRKLINEVVSNMHNSSKSRLDEVNKSLQTKKEKLKEIQESFDNLTTTKKGQPRKNITKAARKTLNELASLKATTEKEIEQLEKEKEDIETVVPYFEDLIQNLSDVGDEGLFMEDLKESIASLEELSQHTSDAIKSGNALIKSIEESLKTAFSLLNSFASRLREAHPNLPANLEALQEKAERFLGEQGAKLFMEEKLGFVEDIINVEDQIEEYKEELKIPDMTAKIQALQEQIKELQEGLNGFMAEQTAKKEILKQLEDTVKKFEEQKKEDELFRKNDKITNELLNTEDKSIQTRGYDRDYEADPKKADIAVVTSSKGVVSDIPHHQRVDVFNNRWNSFPNRERLKGVIITSKNEERYGLKGLTQYLIDESDLSAEEKETLDPNKTIAVVIVEEGKDGVIRLVGMDGKPIGNANPFQTAIFQVFPDPSLTWDVKYAAKEKDPAKRELILSMFRETTPRIAKEHYKKEYKQWVESVLENPPTKPFKVDPSFGTPQYVMRIDEFGNEKRDYDAITPVEDAGLIKSADLEKRGLIKIGTSSAVLEKGSTSFQNALGRPFLSLSNAYVKLKNGRISQKKAEVIHRAIYELAKDIRKNGNAQSDKAKRLTNWLKSVVYWGPPRNRTGYSNIFFERTDEGLMLSVSSKGKKYEFSPTSIENNKNEIIKDITEMYHNIRQDLVDEDNQKQKWKQPYEEFIGFDNDGNPIVREVDGKPYWPNYQTYLLSTNGRSLEELPLYTQLRPLKSEDDVNRRGSYFTLANLQENYTEAPKEVVVKPIKPATAEAPTVATKQESGFDFTGESENIIELDSYGKAKFKLNIPVFVETGGKKGFTPTFNSQMVDLVKTSMGVDENEARKTIAKSILTKVSKYINEYKESITKEEQEEQEEIALTPTLQFDLNGETTNEVETEYGVAKFKLNGEVFNETNGKKGFTPTFNSEMEEKVIKLAKDAGEEITQKEARIKIARAILEKVRPQLDAMKAPTQEAPKSKAGISEIDDDTKFKNIIKSIFEIKKGNLVLPNYLKPENVEMYSAASGEGYILKININGIDHVAIMPEQQNLRFDSIERLSKFDFSELEKVEDERKIKLINEYSNIYDLEIKDIVTKKFGKEDADFVIDYLSKNKDVKQKLTALEQPGVFIEAPPVVKEEPVVIISNTPAEITDEDVKRMDELEDDMEEDPLFRKKLLEETKTFRPENWKKVETWLKANFPNIPIYRVKNVIRGTNGEEAWGMFKNGAIYVYENAEVGTIYHEVFEGVWSMFATPEEKVAVLSEFRSRKGSFIDRPTRKSVNYADATDDEIREQLAEEFRDYVLYKKIPAKPTTGKPWIVKLFADLVNFIKTFFTGEKAQVNTANLFEKIGTGYYKGHSPYMSSLAFAKEGIINIEEAFADKGSVLRIKDIPANEVHEMMQQLTYRTLFRLYKTKQGLFGIDEKVTRKELYKDLKVDLEKTVLKKRKEAKENLKEGKITQAEADVQIAQSEALWKKVITEWDEIQKKHEEYIKAYDVQFNEDEEAELRSDERTKESGWTDATKIDNFRKSSGAVKLMLSTLFVTDSKGEPVYSNIGGYQLIPLSTAFMKVMNQVHTSRSISEMLTRLWNMAKDDSSYIRLYELLTGKKFSTQNQNDISELNEVHDGQMLASFWRTFKKMNPDVKNVFIFENGDVQVGDSNLATAARQIRSEYVNNLLRFVQSKNPYFVFDPKKKVYIGVKGSAKADLKNIDEKVAFLKELGINFTPLEVSMLSEDRRTSFDDAVNGIRKSIREADTIVSPGGKSLEISNRLMSLSLIRAAIDNPEFDSTFFNVKGERTQTFIGVNAMSNLYDALSQVDSLEELIGTEYEYLVTDVFAKEYTDENGKKVPTSVILKNMFSYADGQKIKGSDRYMKPGWVDGTIDMVTGKKKQSANLTYKERLIQEINLNISGYYYSLIPGDASLQWMHFMGNHISADALLKGYSEVHDIFKGYFISELLLSRDNRRIKGKNRNKKDLRFFRPILDSYEKGLHDKIIKDERDPLVVYKDYSSKINAAVEAFVQKEMSSLETVLYEYGIAETTSEGNVEVTKLDFKDANNMTSGDFKRELTALTINFMVNNIELHKLLYSDPYQYADELKRIKSFTSPRQAIASDPTFNKLLQKIWNKKYEDVDDIGRDDFEKLFYKTVTLADVKSLSYLKDYGVFDETDGGGIITIKAYRNFRIRSGDWNDAEELQYNYDVAWEKRDKGMPVSSEEQKLLEKGNPSIKSAYTPIKPIVSGRKLNDKDFNDIVLDKFSLYPLSYRIMKEIEKINNQDGINGAKFYDKLQADNIDYAVFDSGRKVGAWEEDLNPLYNEDGSFNEDPFVGVINVPHSIISIQSEVPSKDEALVTRGSQATKLVSLDFQKAGVPIDFIAAKEEKNKKITFEKIYQEWNALSPEEKKEQSPIHKEIRNNQELLMELTEEGFNQLIKQLGIKQIRSENGEIRYAIDVEREGFKKAAETLREEITKREVNDNIQEALEGFLSGDAVLEATPAYQQVRNILYSIVDRNISSQKITGGQKVQISVALLESTKTRIETINGKQGFVSDTLKFYEDADGKRYCEIMVGRWFDSPLSDEELLNMWYEKDDKGERTNVLTKEGEEALRAVGFRIPTQKQNSIDAFVIKSFLPKEFGDSVVIPSALVKKVGSDFDIDKLFVYLKNMYVNADGKLTTVPFFGYGDQARDKFRDEFYGILGLKIMKVEAKMGKQFNLREFFSDLYLGKIEGKPYQKWIPIFKTIFEDELVDGKLPVQRIEEIFEQRLSRIGKKLEELNDTELQSILEDQFVDRMYKRSLENAYMDSFYNIVTNSLNFERLTTPNSADQMKDLAKKITEKLGFESFDYASTGNLLSRRFMSRLRHAYVSGKYAIGIAAVAQTNHARNQDVNMYIDKSLLDNVSETDKEFLGDAEIKFKEYNKTDVDGKTVPTLSFIKDASTEVDKKTGKPKRNFISDIIGQFIDGYVDISKGPWIMELGATPNVAGTWLFLVKLGVPIETVSYFMNQPIIRDYLREVEKSGYTWLFIGDIRDEMKLLTKYSVGEEARKKVTEIPSKDALWDMIGKKDLTTDEKAQQQFILDEFLKYGMMANHLFLVTQATNFDTANFNDPILIFKKREQLNRARKTIISSVDKLIKDDSYIGVMYKKLIDSRDALAEVLKSEHPEIRGTVERVLAEYTDLNDREFVKLGRKAINDLFDWAVQTDDKLNLQITDILLKKDGVAKQVADFVAEVKAKTSHPLHNNHIIKLIVPHFSDKEGGVQNLKIKNKDNKVYDQNLMIYSFRELKAYFEGKDSRLYDNIVKLAVLQSGLSNSPISFTSLIPYDDFKEIYNKVISTLERKGDQLKTFYELNVFQRNNWNDDDIVPRRTAKWKMTSSGSWSYNNNMKFRGYDGVKKAMADGNIPQLMNLSILAREANSDVITYTWEKGEELLTEEEKKSATSIREAIKKKKNKMRSEGDFSFINKGLFKKVYNADGSPLTIDSGKYQKYVYKMINAWGESRSYENIYHSANEFYSSAIPSKIDNGFIKVEKEVSDSTVRMYFQEEKNKKTTTKTEAPLPAPSPTAAAPVSGPSSETKINIYAGTGENADLSNFANRPFKLGDGITYPTVEHAFQLQKLEDSRGAYTQKEKDDLFNKALKMSASDVKAFGRTIKGLDEKDWDTYSSQLMKDLIKMSFEQNPDALEKLLATGNATLTHKYKGVEQDNGRFSRLLMEVREELRTTRSTSEVLSKEEQDIANTNGFKEYYSTAPEWMGLKEAIEYYKKCM